MQYPANVVLSSHWFNTELVTCEAKWCQANYECAWGQYDLRLFAWLYDWKMLELNGETPAIMLGVLVVLETANILTVLIYFQKKKIILTV